MQLKAFIVIRVYFPHSVVVVNTTVWCGRAIANKKGLILLPDLLCFLPTGFYFSSTTV